jgi:ATP-dependent DNA helicase RecG
MTSKLPINLKDLLHQRKVEGERIEYKAGWNPDRSCALSLAFANDFENLVWGITAMMQDLPTDKVCVTPLLEDGTP